MKTKKNILLTGAGGAVGYEVLKQLSTQLDAINLTLFDLKTQDNIQKFKSYKEKVNILYGDISDNNDILQSTCADIDIVIHLAAMIPPQADEYPDKAHQVNTIGTQNILRNLKKYSPEAFFLYSSSISVYGDRVNNPGISVGDPLEASTGDEYALTKIAAEKLIQGSSIDWCIFRLSAIMGNHKISKLMFHMPLKTQLEILTPQLAAKAFVKAINQKNQLKNRIFNLGGGKKYRTTYKKYLSRAFQIYGLGTLDFPKKAFAEKNFHCGIYFDGNILEEILHFREGNIENHYEEIRRITSAFSKWMIYPFRSIIKYFLLKKSEPYKAYRSGKAPALARFFLLSLFICFFSINPLFSQKNTLTIKITNVENTAGKIVVGIYNDARSWLKKGKEFISVLLEPKDKKTEVKIEGLPPGSYAVSIYHDSNSNHRCDKNFLGIPTEKIAFSQNVRPRLRKPKYKECNFTILETKSIDLVLFEFL